MSTFIVGRAFEAFRTDAEAPPPLTLRGANAVDRYNQPMPFNPAEDNPTDAYLGDTQRLAAREVHVRRISFAIPVTAV
jgi:hypothetical protein